MDVSRVEGLSDGVFALALTLLIVSVEVPNRFEDLMGAIRMLPAFAACFAILMWFWGCHYVFFRRYGLQDTVTITLNSVLLFVVLFYVFPLKYLMGLFLNQAVMGGAGSPVSLGQLRLLFVLYGAGFVAIAGVYAWMHAHALRLAGALQLEPHERLLTRGSIVRMAALMGIGTASIAIALLAPGMWVTAAGFLYCLVGVSEGLLAWRYAEGAKRLQKATPPAQVGPAAC